MQSQSRQILIGWMRQFGITLVVYLGALTAATWSLTSLRPGAFRTALVLAPILPGLALIGLTIHSYKLSDEYIRLRTLQAASVAALVVAVFSLIYSFLELLGLPRLSSAWISNILWAVFVVQMVRLVVTGK